MKCGSILAGARLLLFISAITVSAITFSFTHRLRVQAFLVSWAFFFLQGTAILTMIALPVNELLICLTRLRPLYNTLLNVFIGILWIAAFILVTVRTHFALTRSCSKSAWANADGVVVCKLYKTLFASAIVGCVSSLCTLAFDFTYLHPKLPRISYTRAHSDDMDSIVRGRNSISEPLFLQPFDANSSDRLVPEPYNGASSASEGRYEPYGNVEGKVPADRSRARSYSPRTAVRSSSPLLGLQLRSAVPTLERGDGRRSRPSSAGPSTALLNVRGDLTGDAIVTS